MEPRVRRVAADHLGVEEADLRDELSLVDDLAADSLDLAELGLALEDELELAIPERVLAEVRTYGDLVEAILLVAQEALDRSLDSAAVPAEVVARVVRAEATPGTAIERAGSLTPYLVQTLSEDAGRAGPGSRLEITVLAPDDTTVGRVRARFARLAERGVDVRVQREPLRPRRHPDAA
ncbi:MAG: acyl carrier protein [bacterium]|nr:acyl carrier protein [bacterium]